MIAAQSMPSIVIGRWPTELTMRLVSLKQPGKILISWDRPWMARDGAHIQVTSRNAQRFITALLTRPGVYVSHEEMIDFIFGEREDGGPDDVVTAIARFRRQAEIAGAALGFSITTQKTRGFSARFKQAMARKSGRESTDETLPLLFEAVA